MDFDAYLRGKDLSTRTVRGYVEDIALYAAWFISENEEPLTPPALTPTDIKGYRAWLITRGLRPASINRQLAAIRAWGEWAVATRQIETNPAAAVHGIQQQPHSPKWLDKKQQARLVREIERRVALARTNPARRKARRDLTILTVLLHTGLRIGELCALKAGDVTLGERRGKVTVIGKGSKQREVPLNAAARSALAEWHGDWASLDEYLFQGDLGPLTRQSVGRMLAEYGRRAEVPVSPHVLRHTFAKNLVDAGVPLDQVAVLLGHSKLETTRLYTLPGERDLERAVAKLEV